MIAGAIPMNGLTEEEVQQRRSQGQGNNVKFESSRSYRDILVSNLLNPICVILFAIGAMMIAIGRPGDAVAGVGIILFNIIVSVIQEVRAKKQLDKIALLARPKVGVMRDGHEKYVDPSELVCGDVVIIKPGDQIVVDGIVQGDGRMSVDESLLTGESDLIAKGSGDQVFSGSFCVSGKALYQATGVGSQSYANKLTEKARKFRLAETPLQRELNLILRLLTLFTVVLGVLILAGMAISRTPLDQELQASSVVAGLVPNGLVLIMILAYSRGALRISQHGALVQQVNAIESLSNVTVLCSDKTGTLTTNKLRLHDVYPTCVSRDELMRLIGDFSHSATAVNSTTEALINQVEGRKLALVDEIPFSSQRKWSGVVFNQADLQGLFVLGAWEMLQKSIHADPSAIHMMETWSDQGFRVLVFARNISIDHLLRQNDEPVLPDLEMLGVICFSDELRQHLQSTVEQFKHHGIQLKIISGDHPQTVAALARQAGLTGELQTVSGLDLVDIEDDDLIRVVNDVTVFGRITPEQKEKLVEALRSQGHYVAMIGDGVNDVLSLKKANLGIAMESGSSAARSVADMVLLKNSFEALLPAFTEGQRIINGMRDILCLFLTRAIYSAMLILALAVIGLGFPFVPKQNTLFVLFTVGIPTFALALWARPGPLPRKSMIQEIAHFVIPASFMVFIFGLFVYCATYYVGKIELSGLYTSGGTTALLDRVFPVNQTIGDPNQVILESSRMFAQSALTAFALFSGLLLVVFVEPPVEWFTGGDKISGDWRPTILSGVLLVAFIVIIISPSLRSSFELMGIFWWGYLLILLTTLVWMLVLRAAWRRRWMERFLGME